LIRTKIFDCLLCCRFSSVSGFVRHAEGSRSHGLRKSVEGRAMCNQIKFVNVLLSLFGNAHSLVNLIAVAQQEVPIGHWDEIRTIWTLG
jgi:hypothetical protein